jgi:nicotinic acid phosphoribosyltransferase
VDKPYTTIQCDNYQLTIHNGIAPLNPENDNVDVQVTFPNGESFSAVFFTLQNIYTLIQHYNKTGECANGLYFWASGMIIVQELTEQSICETIDNLLAEKEFKSVFSKNEESTIISPKDGDKLFKRFDESL